MDWSTSARCFAYRAKEQKLVSKLLAEISHDGALYDTGAHKQHLKNGTRPLGPAQPSAPPACLWVQGTDQEVLGEGGRAVGAEVEDEA